MPERTATDHRQRERWAIFLIAVLLIGFGGYLIVDVGAYAERVEFKGSEFALSTTIPAAIVGFGVWILTALIIWGGAKRSTTTRLKYPDREGQVREREVVRTEGLSRVVEDD